MPSLFSFSSDFIEREFKKIRKEVLTGRIQFYYNNKLVCYLTRDIDFLGLDETVMELHKIVELDRGQLLRKYFAIGINRYVIEYIERWWTLGHLVIHFREYGKELIIMKIPYRYFRENRRLIEYEEQQYMLPLGELISEGEFYELLDEAKEEGERIIIEWYYEKGRLKKEVRK